MPWESWSVSAHGPTTFTLEHQTRGNIAVMTPAQFATFQNGGTVYAPRYGAPTTRTTVPIPGAGTWYVVIQYV